MAASPHAAMLPFTHDQFLAVFAQYNVDVWPAQVVAYWLGAAIAGCALANTRTLRRWVPWGLALMWLWTGLAYHIAYFSHINKAALLFGAMFVVQAVMLLPAARRDALDFNARGLRAWAGWGLIVYAAALYPLVGWLSGNAYPAMPMFGITPCPLTLFTFGLLLLNTMPARRLLAIPVVWSLIGGSAAFLLQVPQDWLLLASGVLMLPLLWRKSPAQ